MRATCTSAEEWHYEQVKSERRSQIILLHFPDPSTNWSIFMQGVKTHSLAVLGDRQKMQKFHTDVEYINIVAVKIMTEKRHHYHIFAS